MTRRRIVLVLNDVRSVFNTASMFRTADAAGVEKIYLCGYTPAPTDRFGRTRKDFAKVSLGAELSVPWEAKNIDETLTHLKTEGFFCAALEQDTKALDYRVFEVPERVALIVGNEVEGISKDVLKASDAILEIPMQGKKESLNVEVAAGVALFSLLKKDQ
jgi:23S rRNA (guanosine2251-2'-O)-methyltransferase